MAGRYTSARFVGRAGEFARLAGALDAAAEGRPSTLLLGADIGLGASRFVDESVARIGRLSSPLAVVRCRAGGDRAGLPYGPVVAGLAPLLRDVPDDDVAAVVGPSAGELARLLPGLDARLEMLGLLPDRPRISDPERRQAVLLEAILGLLSRLAERQPMLVIIEDLHRVDPATRSVAAFLARVSRGQHLALLATYQPDALDQDHPLRETLAAMADAPEPPTSLSLAPLGRDELAELITGVEGDRPTASVLLLVSERSRGNPLIAEELLAARRELSSASLTGTLASLVRARLALRSPECRRVLRLLAPAERPMSRTELARVAAAFEEGHLRPPPRSTSAPRRGDAFLDADLAAGVAEAMEHGFVVERSPSGGNGVTGNGRESAKGNGHSNGYDSGFDDTAMLEETSLEIRHELVARAIATDILPRQRPRHQAALATAAEDRPGIAVGHWLAAHQPAPARKAAIAEAAEAEAIDAPEAALEALELALELTDAAAAADGPVTRAMSRTATLGQVDDSAELQARAAEAAFAADRAPRAVAFAEIALAGLDERRDAVALALLTERLAQFRRAAGDHDGAIVAARKAVRLMPKQPTPERARVVAALAQLRMLDGTFSESIRLAREAIATARAANEAGLDARAEEAHALTTLGVAEGWGDDPEAAVTHLREGRDLAAEIGHIDGVFRATANMTTILDLDGQREAGVEAAYDGIEAARAAGQEAVYGNFLRGNAADSLFSLGRWDEARAQARIALAWSPGGIGFVNSAINLAIVEVESESGESAGRLLGRLLLELETIRDSQYAGPAYGAAASYALWNDDAADARRAADLAWSRVHDTEDWVLAARLAATSLEVQSVAAAAASERRDLATIVTARETATRVLTEAEAAVKASGVAAARGSRREADARIATARAYRARLDGRDDPSVWSTLAERWAGLGDRYQAAKAQWRQAEAALIAGDARVGRSAARKPLIEAVTVATELGALPLLRRLEELAGRALIRLPEELASVVADRLRGPVPEPAVEGPQRREPVAIPIDGSRDGEEAGVPVAAGVVEVAASVASGLVGDAPTRRGDTFGLSPREREVLGFIAQGRTNREIGDRLFISQKTVGVHVGNILSKLGVSGRVEAAAVAIRLELTDRR